MKRLQLLAYSWAIRAFGVEHVLNKKVRALRLVEEAIEVAQACGVSIEDVAMTTSIVYSRPPGEVLQELGGVAMTFAVLCESHGVQIPDVMLVEFNRVISKPVEHFAARNAEKINPDAS